MTYIKNNKTLVAIIAILFLSNIALLYFFIQKCDKDKKPQQKSFREMMVQTLRDSVGFNDQQVAQYEQLSNKHKEAMKPMFDELRQTKDSLYSLLLSPSASDSLSGYYYYLEKIGERQKNIDQKIFNHFVALREICTAEQRPKFDIVIQRTFKKMIGKR